MGQCSTLPAETRGNASGNSGGRRGEGGIFLNSSNNHNNNSNDLMREQRYRLNDGGRKESLDFNAIIDNNVEQSSTVSRVPSKFSRKGVAATKALPPGPLDPFSTLQIREPEHLTMAESCEPDPMEIEAHREDVPIVFPPPPEHAVRTRCYKLNLDSDISGQPSTQLQRHNICFGPFSEPPPFLTYSSSEDSSQGASSITVAIQTAQIFRGITVSRDGTILSQNARATRSNRGNKTKRGEKSRQAAKIDKAKDLVEESIVNGKKEDSDEPANMVSLVIVGEYDDMKQLVRDGSRKLREAEGLPDDVLFSTNRPRLVQRAKSAGRHELSSSSSAQSPRRRPTTTSSLAGSHRNTSVVQPSSPEKAGSTSGLPQSAPPKLKSHPRDTRSGRKEERTGIRMRLDSCNDFMEARRAGGMDDGDWSHAWNIWNCGGAGTVSPLQPSSPKDGSSKVVYEARDATFGNSREINVTGRAD
jgi:hypothetical protein